MSADRTQQIRQWAMKKERPSTIRVTSVDGEVRDVPIPVKVRWADVAATINDLEPALLEALNDDGDTLRTQRFGRVHAIDDSVAGDPVDVTPLHDDPESARMMHFANLIHRSYEFSTGLAFDKFAEFMERMLEQSHLTQERLERVEAAYQVEMHARMQAEVAAQQDDGGGANQILQAFGTGMNQGKSNGKPRRPPAPGFGMSSEDEN